MAPSVDDIAAEFEGRVVVEKVNLADSPEVAAKLGVMAVPTIIAKHGERELFRVTGRRSPAELRQLFAAAAHGSTSFALGGTDRMLRGGSGAALIATGALLGPAWPLIAVGAGLVAWSLLGGSGR